MSLLRVLIVEDQEEDARLLVRRLEAGGYAVEAARVETGPAMRAALAEREWDLILADYGLPEFSGLAALVLLKESGLDVPFIVVSGAIGEEAAATLMRLGARDFVRKHHLGRLLPAVERELREAAGRRTGREADRALRESQARFDAVSEQLLQAQKMEAVGRLAGGVAHDFNNMLSVINGYAEIVLGRDDLAPETRDALKQVQSAGQRAASLTRQLLTFSRKETASPRALDLNQLVAGVETMLRRLIGEDIVIRTRFAPDLGAVRADPGQLEQVIVNLAVNARDAMPRGGFLLIETGNAPPDSGPAREAAGGGSSPYVLLAVSDTGTGMDRETLSHIFEPFFTTKAEGIGTGLGLSTVYGIVQQSGGFVEVESEPGAGTTFRIYLPRIETPEALAATERRDDAGDRREPLPLPARSAPQTVLVVEDDG